MKNILTYLRNYMRTEFHLGLYLSLGLFLSLAIYFNYSYSFERKILDSFYGQPIYLLFCILYYAIPYLIGCLAITIFTGKKDFWSNYRFYLILFIFVFTLSFESFWHWYNWFEVADDLRYFSRKMIIKVVRTAIYLLPITIYFFWFKKNKLEGFYGLNTKNFSAKPYLLMALFMMPLLVWASFNSDFLNTYPTYNPGRAETYLELAAWKLFIPYEFLYALTFMALEIMFRGFLIFEMEEFLGSKVVIPMVCVYCTLHFGKPMMETISSIFGGFLLGVIALKSRSVYGGVWIHIFIAVGMDALAFIQKEYLIEVWK